MPSRPPSMAPQQGRSSWSKARVLKVWSFSCHREALHPGVTQAEAEVEGPEFLTEQPLVMEYHDQDSFCPVPRLCCLLYPSTEEHLSAPPPTPRKAALVG